MLNGLSEQTLANENRRFLGTGGRSQENASLGFLPAFRDAGSGAVYRSCFTAACVSVSWAGAGAPH
jgi:hypothetical protein